MAVVLLSLLIVLDLDEEEGRKIMVKTLSLTAAFFFAAFVSASAAEAVVTQQHSTFDVDTLTVKAGDTVVFKNNDDFVHNIRVVNAQGYIADRGMQKHGQDIKYTFPEAGTYNVRCSLHPKMTMVINAQ